MIVNLKPKEVGQMTVANDLVEITCYGQKETRKRWNAIMFYTEAAAWCEGHENERYLNILEQLHAGFKEIFDEG